MKVRELKMSPLSRKTFCGVVSVLLVFCLAAVPVFAQAAQIQHDAPACVSAGTFPLLSAEIAGDLATARVYFRCEQFQDFYFVEMASTDSGWQAVLPHIPAIDTAHIKPEPTGPELERSAAGFYGTTSSAPRPPPSGK